jgi:hypothetical protein
MGDNMHPKFLFSLMINRRRLIPPPSVLIIHWSVSRKERSSPNYSYASFVAGRWKDMSVGSKKKGKSLRGAMKTWPEPHQVQAWRTHDAQNSKATGV